MDPIRNGNFNSSEIVALTKKERTTKANEGKEGFGEAALTFIEECNMERELGQSITGEVNARPLTYGKVLEPMVHEKLPTEYVYCSDETKVHSLFDCWVGSKDGYILPERIPGGVVTDIKNPMTLKSFMQLVQPLYDGLTGMDAMNAIRFGYTDSRGFEHSKHKDGEKFYWQLTSNACIEIDPLTGKEYEHCRLIVHMPYFSELGKVKMLAQGNDNAMWIAFAKDGELPYLIDGGKYKDVNVIHFTPPQEDRDFLKKCVIKGSLSLVPRHQKHRNE